MDEIGARAGLSGPALYRHFADKEKLIDAAMLQTVRRWTRAVTEDNQGETPTERLKVFLRSILFAVLEDHNGALFFLNERTVPSHQPSKALDDDWATLTSDFLKLLAPLQPEMSSDEAIARLEMILATLTAFAGERPKTATARTTNLIVASASAVLLERPAATLPSNPAKWRLPPTTRELILDAATRLFGEFGYDGIRTEDIGAAVGISGPAVYRHYASKADILLDIFEIGSAEAIIGIRKAIEVATDANEALERIAQNASNSAMRRVDATTTYSRGWNSLPADDYKRMIHWRNYFREIWARTLREVRPEISLREAGLIVGGAVALLGMAGRIFGRDPTELVMAWCRGAPRDPSFERLTARGAV